MCDKLGLKITVIVNILIYFIGNVKKRVFGEIGVKKIALG
jgi:hypothetical protein